MMKKLVCMVLAMLMLCACALADDTQVPESAVSFDMSIAVPAGYTLGSSRMEDEVSVTALEPDDVTAKPELCLVIAYSEEYADVSMTRDMTDEQIKGLYELVSEGYSADGYTVGTTDDGWKYLLVIDNEEDNGYATMIMVHNGYFIELFANYTDYRPITEADLADALALLDSYMIVDAAK